MKMLRKNVRNARILSLFSARLTFARLYVEKLDTLYILEYQNIYIYKKNYIIIKIII